MSSYSKKLILNSILLINCLLLFGFSFGFMQFKNDTNDLSFDTGNINITLNSSDEVTLINVFPSELDDVLNSNQYIDFTVQLDSTYNQNINYNIKTIYGSNVESKNRINDEDLRFMLIDKNTADVIFVNESFSSINDNIIYNDNFIKDNSKSKTKSYRLYIWISDDIVIGDYNYDYTYSEWSNLYASVKVEIETCDTLIDFNYDLTYSLNLDLNGGSIIDTIPSTYTYGDNIYLTSLHTKTDYVFKGLCTDSSLKECSNTLNLVTPTSVGDIKLYVKWEYSVVTNSITYVLNDGSIDSNDTFTYPSSYNEGDSLTINGVPIKTGNTFNSWCLDSSLTNCSVTQSISSTDTGNKTFYAKWDVNSYTITYYLNGGTESSSGMPTSYTYGTGATVNGTPTKDNYTFVSWCTNSGLTSCNTSYTISSSTTGDKKYYAKWEASNLVASMLNTTCSIGTAANDNSYDCYLNTSTGILYINTTMSINFAEDLTIDVMSVGGGGGGGKGSRYIGAGGGGGGYTKTTTSISISKNTDYSITIGSGGAGSTSMDLWDSGNGTRYQGSTGGTTKAVFGSTTVSASGGKGGTGGNTSVVSDTDATTPGNGVGIFGDTSYGKVAGGGGGGAGSTTSNSSGVYGGGNGATYSTSGTKGTNGTKNKGGGGGGGSGGAGTTDGGNGGAGGSGVVAIKIS